MKNYVEVIIEYVIYVFWGKNLWSNYIFLLFFLKFNLEMKNCVLIFCVCCIFWFFCCFLLMFCKIFRVVDFELNIDFYECLMVFLCDVLLFIKKFVCSRLWKYLIFWEIKILRRINKLMLLNEIDKIF